MGDIYLNKLESILQDYQKLRTKISMELAEAQFEKERIEQIIKEEIKQLDETNDYIKLIKAMIAERRNNEEEQ